MPDAEPIDVDAFALILKRQVNAIQHTRVSGTIGKVTTSSSNHTYFELSGRSGRVSCVAWSSLNVKVHPGNATVLVRNVDFYPPSGRVQAIVAAIEQEKDAEWVSPKEMTLGRLARDGLIGLDTPKRPLPTIATHLAIVTSVGSAAYHDMMQSIRERWEGLRVSVIDAPVQGDRAAAMLIEALRVADRLESTAIICARGGGSESDLAAFDDEALARALAACKTPTICAVGHESDHSVCDAVATWRAKTPTAAIEMAVPRRLAEMRAEIDETRRRLHEAWTAAIEVAAKRRDELGETLMRATDGILDRAAQHARMKRELLAGHLQQVHVRASFAARSARQRLRCELERKLERSGQRLVRMRQSLREAGRARWIDDAQTVYKLRAALQAAYPVPGKGLAMVQKNKRRIDDVDDLQPEDQIAIQLSNGVAFARIIKCHRRE